MYCKYLLISLIASSLLLLLPSVLSASVSKEKKERPKKLSASINPERLKALKQSLEIKLFLKMTFPDACPVGIVEPIWEGDAITETYCRCPGGSYGFTCQENFVNPCSQNGAQYSSADGRVPANYFIECNGPIPYLIKCAKGTVWNQRITVCDWDRSSLSVRKNNNGGYQQKDNVLSYDEDNYVLKPVHLNNPYSIQTIIQTDTYKQAAAQKDVYKNEFDQVIKQTIANSYAAQPQQTVIQTPPPVQQQQRPYESPKNYQTSQPPAVNNQNDYRFDLLLINQQNQPDMSSPYQQQQSNLVAEQQQQPMPLPQQPIQQQQQQPGGYYNQQPAIVQTMSPPPPPQQQAQNNQYGNNVVVESQPPRLPIQQTTVQQAPPPPPPTSYQQQQVPTIVQTLPPPPQQQQQPSHHQFDMPDFYHQQPNLVNQQPQQPNGPVIDNSINYQQVQQQQPNVETQSLQNAYGQQQQQTVPIQQQQVDNPSSYSFSQPQQQLPIQNNYQQQQPQIAGPSYNQQVQQIIQQQQPNGPVIDNSINYQQVQQQPIVETQTLQNAPYSQQQPSIQPVQQQLPIQNNYQQPQQIAGPSYNQQVIEQQQAPPPPPPQQQQQGPYYGQQAQQVVDPSLQQSQTAPSIIPEQPQQQINGPNVIEQSFGNTQRVMTAGGSVVGSPIVSSESIESSSLPSSGGRSILETIQKPIISATMNAIYEQIQRSPSNNGGVLRTSQSMSGQPQQMILDTMIRPPQSSPLIILQQPNNGNGKNGIGSSSNVVGGPVIGVGVGGQQQMVGGVVASTHRPGQLVSNPIVSTPGLAPTSGLAHSNGLLGSGAGSFTPNVPKISSIPPPSSSLQQQQQRPGLVGGSRLLRMLMPQVTPSSVNGDQQIVNVKIPFDKSEMSPDCANNLPNGLNLAMSVSFF